MYLYKVIKGYLNNQAYLNNVIKMAFTCNYCNKNYSEKRSLKRHIKLKHQVTNIRCEKCEFTTDRLDFLKRHNKINKNKIKCPGCSVEFSRKDSIEKQRKI